MKNRTRALGAFLALSLALCTLPARAGSPEEDVAVVRAMLQRWNQLDWEGVIMSFTEDGVLHSMMAEPIVGRDAIRTRLTKLSKGVEMIDLQLLQIGAGDGVVFTARHDRFRVNGHDGELPVAGVFTVRDGKISEWREYYDHASFLRELGASETADASCSGN